MSNCNGRYIKNINPTTGAVESVVELVDATGAHLNPANVITDQTAIDTILATLQDPCTSDIDWESEKDYICVSDDGSGTTPSGSPETWVVKEWYEKNEDPDVIPILRRTRYIAADRSVAFQEDFDATGASTGTTGTLPVAFTLGACQTSLISVSAC